MRIAVDTGGTFTDCVIAEKSCIRILKVFSSPDDPARNIVQGIGQLLPGNARGSAEIFHGTTVGTNNLLERRGARVALATTAGFEDLVEIGRQNRPQLYNLNVRRNPPLVPGELRFGIRERTAADGTILIRPTAAELDRVRKEIRRSGAESVALCLLFSFANSGNERTVAAALRRLGLPVSVSHEILPEFREYERLSTVAINAFLAPGVGQYMARLERAVQQQTKGRSPARSAAVSTAGRLFIMQSSGGITTAQRAAREPVRTILSGPAGGVVAARWLADALGIRRAISFDMGGTSTDVCLLDGAPRTTHETTLAGLPVAVPVLDIHSVGAGGGSLAHFDAGGALRVGPQSAGALPGPISYGKGGTQPTVTDANLLLGRLDPDSFLGGSFQLSTEAVPQGFQDFLQLARRRGRRSSFGNSIELAGGIVAISNATMEKALRVISVERGYDPRDFTLICFGGGGGLHAAELAASLGLAQVIVPSHPGAFSAIGILISDVVKDVSQCVLQRIGEQRIGPKQDGKKWFANLTKQFIELERQAKAELRRDRFPVRRVAVERRVDLRYAGQSYELNLPFRANSLSMFHVEHNRAYGYCDRTRPIEVVNLRLRLLIPTRKPPLRAERVRRTTDVSEARLKLKPVWFGGRSHKTPFFERHRLRPGMSFRGPAVVVEYSSTTLVPPGFVCRVDEYRDLVLTRYAR